MTEIRPFPGLRFDTARVRLDDVVSPPYDIIDADEDKQLRARSRYNMIHLDLPRAEGGGERYQHTADLLRNWQETGVLVEDDEPALYLVTDTFDLEGRTFERTGLVGAVRLEPFGEGSIFAHEGTLSAPKADRLKLMRATAANLSSIMAIFGDPAGDVRTLIDEALAQPAPATCSTPTGTCHLRRLTDSETVERIVACLRASDVVIADGHHRYETALAYRDGNPGGDERADYVMMHLVAAEDETLKVLPTHRLVKPGVGPALDELLVQLGRDFVVTEVSARSLPELPGPEMRFGTFLLYADRRTWRLALRDEVRPGDIQPGTSEDWCRLDVAALQKRVFEPLLGLTIEKVKGEALVGYSHDVAEAVGMVDSGDYARAFLVRPTLASAVTTVARRLEKMPPKSTYFYPKVTTGMVLRRLG